MYLVFPIPQVSGGFSAGKSCVSLIVLWGYVSSHHLPVVDGLGFRVSSPTLSHSVHYIGDVLLVDMSEALVSKPLTAVSPPSKVADPNNIERPPCHVKSFRNIWAGSQSTVCYVLNNNFCL